MPSTVDEPFSRLGSNVFCPFRTVVTLVFYHFSRVTLWLNLWILIKSGLYMLKIVFEHCFIMSNHNTIHGSAIPSPTGIWLEAVNVKQVKSVDALSAPFLIPSNSPITQQSVSYGTTERGNIVCQATYPRRPPMISLHIPRPPPLQLSLLKPWATTTLNPHLINLSPASVRPLALHNYVIYGLISSSVNYFMSLAFV